MEEVERMIEKEIFEMVPRSQVPSYQKVLRAVWFHRRKTKTTVQWSISSILLIISQLKGHKSRQVDYVRAFPQAPLEDEEVFMEIPA
eukprot:1279201-Ditylum_brightwellii.AAC.1